MHTEKGESRSSSDATPNCTKLLNCTKRDIKSKRHLAANIEHVLFNELCKDHEVSHEMRAVSPSLRYFMGGSVSSGLGWVTSLFPTSLPTSLYRSQDNRTNVYSRLNLYLFSQDKQERITMIRLMRCFSNCGSSNCLKLSINEQKRQLH